MFCASALPAQKIFGVFVIAVLVVVVFAFLFRDFEFLGPPGFRVEFSGEYCGIASLLARISLE